MSAQFDNAAITIANAQSELTLADAAKLTNTSVPTIRRWIAQGRLRAYRYGDRVIRIDPADLRRMRREVTPVTFAHVSGDA